MITMKFGGSSVADANRIRHVVDIVDMHRERTPVVVLSAMADTTDHLLEAANTAIQTGVVGIAKITGLHIKTMQELGVEWIEGELAILFNELHALVTGIALTRELTGRAKDHIVSFGERLSVRVVAAYFNKLDIQAKAIDAWDIGFVSDSNFTAADLFKESWTAIPKYINPVLEAGFLPVVTGFIAKDGSGRITTLGRGGSDRSATIIAAACGAEEAQVWKDVDGILTADPRIVPDARPVKEVTYDEAAELAYFGAQVLHPRAMRPCMNTGTPVLVKNSYNPRAPGTRIVPTLAERPQPVVAISTRKNILLVDIVSTRMLGQAGFLSGVFLCFAQQGISVDMVATSEVSISLTLDIAYDITALTEELSKIASVAVKTGKAIVTIIGNVRRSSEILKRAFGLCEKLNIQVQMISQGASKVNISFIVNEEQATEVVRGLHQEFFGIS
ncbi:MAG: aspartate kinase [Spirochaetaceae bacterium]|nr:aspartate kinase [Spirochaetaceae bacterium]